MVGTVAGYLALRAYLNSESFREFLSAQVGSAAMVTGDFSPLQWDGLAVETDGFQGTGKGLIERLELSRLATEISFSGVRRGVWVVKSARIHRLEVDFDLSERGEPEPVAPVKREQKVMKEQPGWVPDEVELEVLEIENLVMRITEPAGTTRASGMDVRLRAVSGKHAYEAEVLGGKVSFPQAWAPELRLERIAGTYRDGSLFIDEVDAFAWESGRLNAVGEMNFGNFGGGFHAFEGAVNGVQCDELLDETWAKRLSGEVASTLKISNRSGVHISSGELSISNGVLTALPMLDVLAAYADTRRFRVLQLNEASAKWRVEGDEIRLSELVLGSEGLIQLEGSILIRGEAIEGEFQLGIVPGVLARIPGAETHVFRPGRLGLLWAPVRVTGTLSDPKEDLTQRLVEAAGMRMFERIPESGEQVLKYTRNLLGETPEEAIRNSRRLLEDGGNVIKEAETIIRGFEGILGR